MLLNSEVGNWAVCNMPLNLEVRNRGCLSKLGSLFNLIINPWDRETNGVRPLPQTSLPVIRWGFSR